MTQQIEPHNAAARVLIVDDEPSIRKVLSAHLRRFGYDLATASDGAEGIGLLQEQLFHAVVTDLKMPVVDGMGLLRWVQENQPGLPVILITAHGTVDTAVAALKNGAFDYVTKPFDQDELAPGGHQGPGHGASATRAACTWKGDRAGQLRHHRPVQVHDARPVRRWSRKWVPRPPRC